jgi:hypothetical protein
MRSLPPLSPLTTSSHPNASIIFGDEAFPIFKEIFTGYSRKAADPDHLLRSQFVITSPVTRESVQIFVDVCQGKSSPFDDSQIMDLLLLSDQWSVDSLKDHLLTLLENDDNQILTFLRYAFEKGLETEEYEAHARCHFSDLVEKDEILELPIQILRRIVDVGLQDTYFDKLFVFLRKCLDRFGSPGSILFEGVDLRHFSVSQLEELTARRDFRWCYLSESVCDTISLCISEMARHRLRFDEEHRGLLDLQLEYRRVVSEYQTAQQARVDVLSRLSSVEASLAAFRSSAQGRLDLLESTCVSRSDLEADYPKKSDLETNYTRTSDLAANYARKSDLFVKRVTESFPLIPGSPLNGIIHHLTLEFGGNVHDRGVVAITADRPKKDDSRWTAKDIADLEAQSGFYCANAENMWVCYDFKEMKVALTDYSIRSCHCDAHYNLTSWVVEVSDNGRDWTEADRRENREDLCAQNVVRSFALSKPSTSRYIRLRQIGRNNCGSFDTVISGFELFGALTR